MPENSCDIIIPVWNEREATAGCVDSIAGHTDYPYRLIVIDNGSDKDTAGYLLALSKKYGPRMRLIRNEKNLGFVRAANQGMRISSAPYLCLMNNDTIATDGWLEEMVSVMESGPKIGIVNPSSNTFGQAPSRDESIDAYAARSRGSSGRTQELYACRGFCALIRRNVIERVGLFDEAFKTGYFEETDLSCRARAAGFEIVRAKGSYVYHEEGLSFKGLKERETLFAGNEKIFFERWGRPIRIGCFIDKAGSEERIDRLAAAAARNGHQVFVFLKKGLPWPIGLDHINIRRVDLGSLFFGPAAVYSVLRRKRKKALELLIAEDRTLGGLFKRMKALHGSEVMIGPEADAVLRTASLISKTGERDG